jgi:hypothetical protein
MGRNYARSQVGACKLDSWQPVNGSRVRVVGPAMLWVYAYQNCSGSISTGVEVDIAVTKSSSVGSISLSGYATTGAALHPSPTPSRREAPRHPPRARPPLAGLCAAGGGEYYVHDIANGTKPGNMVWFGETNTTANGTLAGNGANSIVARIKANGVLEERGIRAFVLLVGGREQAWPVCCASAHQAAQCPPPPPPHSRCICCSASASCPCSVQPHVQPPWLRPPGPCSYGPAARPWPPATPPHPTPPPTPDPPRTRTRRASPAASLS